MAPLGQQIAEPILVTGATGFVGATLVSRLVTMGSHAIPVARHAQSGTQTQICDLEDAAAVEHLIGRIRPKTILHLASHVTGARHLDAVLTTFRGTLATTVHVLAAASKAKVERVILAGSIEELPLNQAPRFPYAAAKRAAADYARFFNHALELSTCTARIGMVYGPGQRAVQRLVPYVILSQLSGNAPQLTSGRRTVDWIYIDDVVDGLLAMADERAPPGDSFDLGSGQEASVTDVALAITEITGGPAPKFGAIDDRLNDVDARLDVARTEEALGFRSKVELEQGLRSTVVWYRQQRSLHQL